MARYSTEGVNMVELKQEVYDIHCPLLPGKINFTSRSCRLKQASNDPAIKKTCKKNCNPKAPVNLNDPSTRDALDLRYRQIMHHVKKGRKNIEIAKHLGVGSNIVARTKTKAKKRGDL